MPLVIHDLTGWRWVVWFDALGAVLVWAVRFMLPESPRWLAQQGRLAEAEAIMKSIEAKVTAESGRALPQPGPPSVEDPRAGKISEAFEPQYRTRTIALSVANFFQTVGFYGFANWVPTLLLAKGITVTKTLDGRVTHGDEPVQPAAQDQRAEQPLQGLLHGRRAKPEVDVGNPEALQAQQLHCFPHLDGTQLLFALLV